MSALMATSFGSIVTFFDFIRPNVLFEPPTSFKAGRPEDYAVGSITPNYDQQAYILRTQIGFLALSAVCTHLGCITRWVEDDGLIECPCHGSKFGKDGSLRAGPAPRPLQHILVAVKDGELVVDKGVEVEKDFVLRV
jgi:cytochrome b6-f complex iron-sulfur subunit